MPSGPGAIDAHGIYQYGDSDTQALASDLLNLLGSSVSTQVGQLQGIKRPPMLGAAQYERIATLDGGTATDGAHMQAILGGLGDYGSLDRGTALISFTQRGSNGVQLKVWSWGMPGGTSLVLFYTRQISTFVFELWMLNGMYLMNHGLKVLASTGCTVNLDSNTTTAPSGLTAPASYTNVA